MASQRHHEDPHPGQGISPKLAIVGRLDTTIDGRRLRIDGSEQAVRLTFDSLRDGWRIAQAFRLVSAAAVETAGDYNLRVEVALGRLLVLPLSPTPHWALRALVGSPKHR